MRFYLVLSAFAISSVVAHVHVDKRQDEGHATSAEETGGEISTTVLDSSGVASGTTTRAPTNSGTPVASDQCSAACNSAMTVYSDCHAKTDSAAATTCFCTDANINSFDSCAACQERLGTSDGKTNAQYWIGLIGGVRDLCSSASISLAAPTGVSITTTISIGNPASITPPPTAKATSGAGAGSSKAGSSARSGTSSGASSSPSGASTNKNGAGNTFVISGALASLVAAGALALFM